MAQIPENKTEVFLVGRYFSDLIFTGLPELPRLGHEVYSRELHLVPGGVFTPAVALTRLGVNVLWPCVFGSDPFSQFVSERALAERVDDSHFSTSETPSFRITTAFSYQGERAFLSYVDPLPSYEYGDLIRETRPRWLYITHLLLGQPLLSLVSAAKDAGAQVIMDCQAHDHSISEPRVREALGMVDLFSPNAAEARRMTGKTEISDCLDDLASYTPAVIIKDGKHGCQYRSGDEHLQVASIPVDVRDSTGAGDNFDSGYLYGVLRGYDTPTILRIANICGALSAEGIGGTETAPTERILLDCLKKET